MHVSCFACNGLSKKVIKKEEDKAAPEKKTGGKWSRCRNATHEDKTCYYLHPGLKREHYNFRAATWDNGSQVVIVPLKFMRHIQCKTVGNVTLRLADNATFVKPICTIRADISFLGVLIHDVTCVVLKDASGVNRSKCY